MNRNPIDECRRAFDVMSAWEGTAQLTGTFLHETVAATCCKIAIERARIALDAELTAKERHELAMIVSQAQRAALVEEHRVAIAKIYALVEERYAKDAPPGPTAAGT
jgi:hypothetical protein